MKNFKALINRLMEDGGMVLFKNGNIVQFYFIIFRLFNGIDQFIGHFVHYGMLLAKGHKYSLAKVGIDLKITGGAIHQFLMVPPKRRAYNNIIVKQMRLFYQYFRGEQASQ